MLFLYFYENTNYYFSSDDLMNFKDGYERLKKLISHHYDSYSVISSFSMEGKELRQDDAS